MSFFNTAIKVLVIACGVFFVVFFYICLLWTERDTKQLRNILGAVMISLLTSFKILAIGFALTIFVSFLVKYLA